VTEPREYCVALRGSLEDQHRFIEALPPKSAIAFYLFAYDRETPRDLGLADALAKRGSDITSELFVALNNERDEYHITQLLFLLVRMRQLGRLGPLDGASNAVLASAASRINKIQWYRETAYSYLEVLRQ
jgi:hypothetical protein